MIQKTKKLLFSSLTFSLAIATNCLLLSNISAKPLRIKLPILISEREQVTNNCQPEESVFIMGETANFWVNICGGHSPSHYVGVSKSNGQSIRLPLQEYDSRGDYFVAVNGDYSYLIIINTTKGSFLTVTQNDREILREPLLSW